MTFYLGLPLFQAFLSLALLIIILRAKSQDASRHLFAMYLSGLLVWGILIYLMRSSPDLDRAYFWEKLILPLGLLISVIIYHFSVVFGGFRAKKWTVYAGYICCGLALVLSESGWVVAEMQVKSYGYAPVPAALFPVIALLSYTLVLASIINLWKYSRTAVLSEERNRSTYILVGMVISIIGGVFDVLPLLGLSLYPGVIFGNILFCIITSIAILKYHLMGVQVIIRKGMAYFLTSAIATVPYLIVLFVFERIFRTHIPTWTLVLLFLILAFVLQPIWRIIQSLVDKLFFMSRYDFLKALDGFSQRTHRINDISNLGSSLVKLVEQALQSSSVFLYLPAETGDFNLVSSTKEYLSGINLFNHHPILTWLRNKKIALRREEMTYYSNLQSLTAEEISKINIVHAELFVPVIDKENELVGVLVLGPKMNHQPYSDEDEQIILTVTHRLALEIENARLYSLETAARKELQTQNNLKTEFLHSAAHELKTPLTAIISSSDMLIEKLAITQDELSQKLISNIHESSLAMNRRVSELLDFARVQIGNQEINPRLLDINLVVRDIASRLSPLFVSRQQSLELKVQPTERVKADKDKLEQVFVNLLSNANKYSPNNSCIEIRTKQKNGSVVVEVEDSAPMISESDKNKLFTPYFRGEDVKVRQRIPGLGLGLAISKKIIDLHGGKIWVDCNPGKGNIFAFSLEVSD